MFCKIALALHICGEETMIKFKFLASVMLTSAVAVSSSTFAFAHTHKRTHHYRSSNSMTMVQGPVERRPSWRSSVAPSFLSESRCLQVGWRRRWRRWGCGRRRRNVEI